jgi:hypothetical protein
MKKLVLSLLLLAFLAPTFAQKKSLHRFKHYDGKDYLIFGIGPNYMFGDAGGADFQNLWATDWDVLYTRPSLYIGYQHDWNDYIGNKVLFQYNIFAGNDDNSRNDYRAYSYEANALEVSLQTQVYVFRGRYKRKTYDVYAFAGLSGLYYTTDWTYLDNTSIFNGEVLPGRIYNQHADHVPDGYTYNSNKDAFEYSAGTLAIPFGVGVRFPITDKLYLGGEFGWRYLVGSNADFLDGYYTYWSNMNDSYANLSFVLTYRFMGDDDCYATYGRGQSYFRRRR